MTDQKNSLFDQIEPWGEKVNLVDLLNEISTEINKYSILPKGANEAVTLWVVGTYMFQHLTLYPLLLFTSPEKRCGKTTLLLVTEFLVHSPFLVANITAAALYRLIEQNAPTLLIDEGDTFIAEKTEITGIINSGHTKATARIVRCASQTFEPIQFSTWCPKVIAMIKKPADTLVDRSIVIQLKRKLPTEKTERIRHADAQNFETIRRKLTRFANDYGKQISESRPEIPDIINDRASENWEPLIAIADFAGKEWGELARNSAITISLANDNDEDNLGILLLRDISEIFQKMGDDRISSNDLCHLLCEIEESPWADIIWGGLNARKLAKLLAPFNIRPSTHRFVDKPQKGYLLSNFHDAFLRYLGKSVTPLQPSIKNTSSPTDNP